MNLKRNESVVQIEKNFLEDSSLSWAAKGLLAFILSSPNDWYESELILSSKDIAELESAFKELNKMGYLTKK